MGFFFFFTMLIYSNMSTLESVFHCGRVSLHLGYLGILYRKERKKNSKLNLHGQHDCTKNSDYVITLGIKFLYE